MSCGLATASGDVSVDSSSRQALDHSNRYNLYNTATSVSTIFYSSRSSHQHTNLPKGQFTNRKSTRQRNTTLTMMVNLPTMKSNCQILCCGSLRHSFGKLTIVVSDDFTVGNLTSRRVDSSASWLFVSVSWCVSNLAHQPDVRKGSNMYKLRNTNLISTKQEHQHSTYALIAMSLTKTTVGTRKRPSQKLGQPYT